MHNPFWTPQHPEKTNMAHFMRTIEEKYNTSCADYAALHAWSIQNPAQFWESIAQFFKINFEAKAHTILETAAHMINTKWFKGASFNVTAELLKPALTTPKKTALISIKETGERETLSFEALKAEVAACAAGLKKQGVKAGDRVAGMLPNNHHTIIAMLATASLGAIWSACSPDFGVNASVDRLSQISPKVLFICDGYTYHGKPFDLKDKAKALTEAIPAIEKLVICPVFKSSLTPEALSQAVTWQDFLISGEALETAAYPFDHPWYILFSSGTTGEPKCIMHSTGGTLLQHVKELGLHTNLTTEDTLFFHTTCGWMMWNWMVSGLTLGTTLVLYDGSPMFPQINRLFELLEKEAVTVFGTGARFLAAIEKKGLKPNQTYHFPKLKTILSTGSPLLPEQYDFVQQHIKSTIQLSSISGGTDIVSCFALGNPITPVYQGELQCLGLGMDVQVFNASGKAVLDEIGELVCVAPFPSMPIGFWNDPDKAKYHRAYFETFPGVWAHGDMAKRTPHGGLVIYGRSDAVLNPGGVRIGTAEIYRPLQNMPEVLESIVIGQPWQGDVRVVLFVKLQKDIQLDEALKNKIRQTIRKEASPRHVPAKILDVPDIPRTINGKLVEVAARQTVQGETVKNLGSIENPECLQYFKNRPELAADTIETH